jgi:hypothetical protein
MTEIDEQALATDLFNRCWELLEQEDRTEDDDVELLTAAFSSRFFWINVGAPEQWIISDWMVARAAGGTGDVDLALLFAQRANDAARDIDVPDWLVASTAEGVARAYSQCGDVEEFSNWSALATRLIDVIADPADKSLIASQLASIPLP